MVASLEIITEMFAPRRIPSLLIQAGSIGLLSFAVGCGGNAKVEIAVVTTEPGVAVTGAAAPSGGSAAAPAGGTEKATAAPGATAAVKAEGWGTLKGRVVFDGASPAAKVLVAKGDPNAKDSAVCAVAEIKSERLIVDAQTKGVKNAIVYLARPTAVKPEAKDAAAKAKVVFDQKGCIFEPHFLAVLVGNEVQLKSSDAVGHNINSKVQNSNFNNSMAANGSSTFKAAAAARLPGQVVCDIHPWMTSYWMVLDHPYFAVTDAEGNFEIKDVPAGTQKVVLWQEATQFVTAASGQDVNVVPNGVTTQDFSIPASKVKPES